MQHKTSAMTGHRGTNGIIRTESVSLHLLVGEFTWVTRTVGLMI